MTDVSIKPASFNCLPVSGSGVGPIRSQSDVQNKPRFTLDGIDILGQLGNGSNALRRIEMVRDRIAEINAIRERKGGWGSRHRAEMAIRDCLALVTSMEGPQAPEFIPIRLVTALEVFTRECVAELVDSGQPYTDRARGLTKEVKFDFDLTQALIGKKVSFGELVSHTISINTVGDIETVFSQLTDKSLKMLLEGVHDRWAVDVEGKPQVPIIDDVDDVKKALARLFEVRHVLVHEMPSQSAFDDNELLSFATSAADFALAMEQVVSTLIHGDYPQTQAEMNEYAYASAMKAESELTEAMLLIDPEKSDERIQSAHVGWETYRESESIFVSNSDLPMSGSIAPLLYWGAWEDITRERIKWVASNGGEAGNYSRPYADEE